MRFQHDHEPVPILWWSLTANAKGDRANKNLKEIFKGKVKFQAKTFSKGGGGVVFKKHKDSPVLS